MGHLVGKNLLAQAPQHRGTGRFPESSIIHLGNNLRGNQDADRQFQARPAPQPAKDGVRPRPDQERNTRPAQKPAQVAPVPLFLAYEKADRVAVSWILMLDSIDASA